MNLEIGLKFSILCIIIDTWIYFTNNFFITIKVVAISHYNDVIMEAIASQITSLTIVYSIVCSDADQRKHQSSASLAFVWGIYREPVNSPHKWPVTRKMFPFDDVIMFCSYTYSNDPIYYKFLYKARLVWYYSDIIYCQEWTCNELKFPSNLKCDVRCVSEWDPASLNLFHIISLWHQFQYEFIRSTVNVAMGFTLINKKYWNIKNGRNRFITYCKWANWKLELTTHILMSVNLPSLARIMHGRLVDAKPSSEPMLKYCKCLPWEIVIDFHKFSFTKIHLNISVFCLGLCASTPHTKCLLLACLLL